jgi:hypothetical protein
MCESGIQPNTEIEQLLCLTAGAARSGRSWWLVRRHGAPRFLIPTDKLGRAAGLQLVANRWNRAALRIAFSLPPAAGHFETVSAPELTPLDKLLASVLPFEPTGIAVYCGTASVFRKYTVQCRAADGSVRAYVKVGQGEKSEASLLREAGILRRLAAAPKLKGSVPEVIDERSVRGLRVLALSSPESPVVRAAPRAGDAAVAKFSQGLFAVDAGRYSWQQSPVRQRLRDSAGILAAAGESRIADLLIRGEQTLGTHFGDNTWPHGRIHGDFVPWNIVFVPQVYVFDWEWSRIGLPYHDLLHHVAFPVLGKAGARRIAKLHSTVLSGRWLSNPGNRWMGDGFGSPWEPTWWTAYLAEGLAFYALHAEYGSGPLIQQRLIANFARLLEQALKRQSSP